MLLAFQNYSKVTVILDHFMRFMYFWVCVVFSNKVKFQYIFDMSYLHTIEGANTRKYNTFLLDRIGRSF